MRRFVACIEVRFPARPERLDAAENTVDEMLTYAWKKVEQQRVPHNHALPANGSLGWSTWAEKGGTPRAALLSFRVW